jgi:SAM-dependent methyltransferase
MIKASYLVRPIIAWSLKGSKYTDPIDGRSFKQFLPYGYERVRENVLSPSTLSLERHRLLWLWLTREFNIFDKQIDLLHFAPEQCFYGRFRESENINYTTTDLESPLADVKADICSLPFDEGKFDLILCNHVLEHIPDDTQAMRELYRVLKPGGTAVLQVPLENERAVTFEDDTIVDKEERRRLFGQYDHVRVYGRDYFDKLKSVGFDVDPVDYTAELTENEIETYRLAAGELIPVVKRPH